MIHSCLTRRPSWLLPSTLALALGLIPLAGCSDGGGKGSGKGSGGTDGDTDGEDAGDGDGDVSMRDSDAFDPDPVEWQACPLPGTEDLDCAFVNVPVDYADVDGETIQVVVTRLPASDGEAEKGALFINPGGPGGSGNEFVSAARGWDPELLAAFDIIGFDPRGTNFSEGVDCGDVAADDPSLDPLPTTDAEYQALADDRRAKVEACMALNEALSLNMGTANVARDMDVIRRAIGEEQISFAGFSYGTRVGSYYANLFPDHLRAALLDAGVMPWIGDSFEYSIFAESAVATLDAARAGCGNCSTDPNTHLDQIAAALDALVGAPIQLDMPVDGRTEFTAQDMFGFLGRTVRQPAATRVQSYRPMDQLATATDDAARKGAAAQMLDLGVPEFFGLEFSGFANCGDRIRAASTDSGRAAEQAGADAGRFASVMFNLEIACIGYPEAAMEVPAPPADPVATPPVMVVGSSGDTITPFPWAQALTGETLGAVFVKAAYDGHARAMEKTSSCLDALVMSTLLDAEAPAEGITCGEDPAPGAPCDPANPVCGVDQWCGLGDTAAVPGSDACTPIGPSQDGDACSPGGQSGCDEGLTCQDFGNALNDTTCRTVCTADTDCNGFCTTVGTSSRGACMPECDPFNDTCGTDLACKRIRPRVGGGVGLGCVDVGATAVGDPCNGADECVAGAACQDNVCRELCSTNNACSSGTCTAYTGTPDGIGYCAP